LGALGGFCITLGCLQLLVLLLQLLQLLPVGQLLLQLQNLSVLGGGVGAQQQQERKLSRQAQHVCWVLICGIRYGACTAVQGQGGVPGVQVADQPCWAALLLILNTHSPYDDHTLS
jgi:hypothetical protein